MYDLWGIIKAKVIRTANRSRGIMVKTRCSPI